MSEKELLYIEDTLNHLMYFKSHLCLNKECLTQDDETKMLKKIERNVDKSYQSFYDLLNGVTMESKIALEGILWDLKVMSDLCLHGSIESGTKKINETFKNALMTMLDLQSELYTLMVCAGIYKTENISEIKISKVLNKFTNTLKED